MTSVCLVGLVHLNLNSGAKQKLLAVLLSVPRLCYIVFKDSFAEVLTNVNLFSIFSITYSQVCLMCIRLVDFHEPIYHRLLSLFYISAFPPSFLQFDCFSFLDCLKCLNRFFGGFFYFFLSPLAELLHLDQLSQLFRSSFFSMRINIIGHIFN